jgi:hypothetical protein
LDEASDVVQDPAPIKAKKAVGRKTKPAVVPANKRSLTRLIDGFIAGG